jgi:hypothetical protein
VPIAESIGKKPPFFKQREQQLKKLIREVRERQPHTEEQLEKIGAAFWISDWAHREQKRASGKPYFEHPYATALMAAKHGQPVEMIIGLLLHDTVENQSVQESETRGELAPTVDRFGKIFGNDVAKFVSVLTNSRWNGKRWVFPEENEFYSLPLRPENFTKKMRRDREDIYKNRLFSPGNNLEAVGKFWDVLHNAATLKHLDAEKQERFFRKYRNQFHLLAAVVSKRLALEALDHLRTVNPEVGSRLTELFEREHAYWKDKPFHEAIPHNLFPSLEMIKKHPPAGVKRTVIAYWKGLNPAAAFIVEIPKTIGERSAYALLEDLGARKIEPASSMLHGTLRQEGAGHLFRVSFPEQEAVFLRKQFRKQVGPLFEKYRGEQEHARARKKRE